MNGIASIELGTHTARMLVARPEKGETLFTPLSRERRTIRLADGFRDRHPAVIGENALDRAAAAVEDFSRQVRETGGEIVRAVSTGVTRTAVNRAELLQRVLDRSGVRLRSISGEEEASLTAEGVLHALAHPAGPLVIFDLGGGSTEFILVGPAGREDRTVLSLPLGALVLSEVYFRKDPPGEDACRNLADHVEGLLFGGLGDSRGRRPRPLLIGSGGTATTLGAMIRGIHVSDITPERMNGLVLERSEIEDLLGRLIAIPTRERVHLRGLDPGRADVIPAGAVAVMGILDHFDARRVTLCLSDILEGLLIDCLKGETHD